jgi:hypothetical protein
VGLARKKDDLSFEPTLHETLTDPVIQAVMNRDGVTQDELIRLILAARARLSVPEEAIILPFPVRAAPVERREIELRPKTRWPFCLRAPSQK